MDFKMHLQCLGTCCSGDKLWFPNMTFNGLFSINLKNFELEYHGQIPFLTDGTPTPADAALKILFHISVVQNIFPLYS